MQALRREGLIKDRLNRFVSSSCQTHGSMAGRSAAVINPGSGFSAVLGEFDNIETCCRGSSGKALVSTDELAFRGSLSTPD